LHLAADAGSIIGRAVGGYLDMEAQAGSVRLEVDELKPGEHRIRATMGSVRLDMARGMDVSIETRTSLGSIRNTYPSNASSSTRLLLSTEMGEVRVDEALFDRRTSASPATAAAASARGTATVTEAAHATRTERADPELERILKMVESGEISAHEADELLQAMGRV
jgi:hypothetical protein